MQKGFATVWILLALVTMIGIGGGAYYLNTKNTLSLQKRVAKQNSDVVPFSQPTSTNKPVSSTKPSQIDETANWKTYTALACKECKKFSFLYPPIYQVRTDYMPSGLGQVLVDSEGTYIDHYPLSNEEITKVMMLGVNTELSGYKAFERTVVSTDKSGLYEISLLDFPEKRQGQKFLYETKKDIIHQITEFKKILQTITID